MSDQYMSELHAWILLQHSQSNDRDSWVMLTRDGGIVPIENEKILHTSRARVGLDITTPRELQVSRAVYPEVQRWQGIHHKRAGKLNPFLPVQASYLLPELGSRGWRKPSVLSVPGVQLIYLPASPTETFKSFFTPVLNLTDTYAQSPWLGSWTWGGIVKPVAGGGIPMHIPRVSVRFTFKNGGHSEFQEKFELLKERLHHARELGLNPGQHFEAPPAYEPAASTSASAGGVQVESQPQQQQPPPPAPDEPPPDYVEAQAQAITMQYEERVREEVEREGPERR
ncbi:hypothetical protein N0V88_005311 [Collariella sp. IMI 366227]|nr:hypothetical protein N0V88_005311 [Collariella sp. IMI 366227]